MQVSAIKPKKPVQARMRIRPTQNRLDNDSINGDFTEDGCFDRSFVPQFNDSSLELNSS